MNVLDFYTNLYSHLRCQNQIASVFLTPIRRITRTLANWQIPRSFIHSPSIKQSDLNDKVIVSFTSFPARIPNVWQVVECMFRQTVLPHKVYLWLSKEQFPSQDLLPLKLRLMQNEIFEIRIVEGDIRSHKKYLYISKECPNEMIFLIDDDIYYPTDIIEKSLIKYKENPQSVVCNFGAQITFDESGHHLPYSEWGPIKDNNNIFFGSGGGTLFRPSMMYKDLTNERLALHLTPTADDIWLNAMARLANIRIVHSSDRVILPINNSNNKELSSINNGLSQNDKQIEAIENYYGKCFDRK